MCFSSTLQTGFTGLKVMAFVQKLILIRSWIVSRWHENKASDFSIHRLKIHDIFTKQRVVRSPYHLPMNSHFFTEIAFLAKQRLFKYQKTLKICRLFKKRTQNMNRFFIFHYWKKVNQSGQISLPFSFPMPSEMKMAYSTKTPRIIRISIVLANNLISIRHQRIPVPATF
jgi:hypothetical protein